MAKWPNFPTPHCHPMSLDSASTPAAFAKKEVELGSGAITCTDHGDLSAAYEIYKLAKKNNLMPVLGLEAYLRDDNCPILKSFGIDPQHPTNKKGEENTKKPKTYAHYLKYMHLTMHFLDQEALHTAIKLLSKAPLEKHGHETKPLFDWNNLEELGSKNVIFGSGCLIGVTARHLVHQNRPDIAEAYYQRVRGIVKPGNFMVEVFPHVCDKNWTYGVFITVNLGDTVERFKFNPTKVLRTNLREVTAEELEKTHKKVGDEYIVGVKNYSSWQEVDYRIEKIEFVEDFIENECTVWAPNGDLQKGVNEYMLGLASKYKDPVILSDDSHFVSEQEYVVQTVRLMQNGNWRMANSYHRRTSDECWEHFKNTLGTSEKEFEGWLNNGQDWLSKFKNMKLEYKVSLPTKFFPEDTLSYTKKLIDKHGRMDWSNEVYCARLRQEIELFYNNGIQDLLPYFMTDEEVCSLYTSHNLLTGPGRGSAAGVLLSYLLGITHVDPIKYNLSLDRFITLDRIKSGAWPDIDQDLPNRDLLVKTEQKKELIEIELDNGKIYTIDRNTLIKTDKGLVTAEEAVRLNAEILIISGEEQ